MAENRSGNRGGAQSGSAASAPVAEKKTRVRKTAVEAQAAMVKSARDTIRTTTAKLQAAHMKSSGNLEGNPELVAAYKTFDAVLAKIETPAAPAV